MARHSRPDAPGLRAGRTGLRACLLGLILAPTAGAVAARAAEAGPAVQPAPAADTYATYGVHNPPQDSTCSPPTCAYPRSAGEPTDPLYPSHWTSHWTMYRVFRNSADHPPPYAGQPPAPLRDGVDYETSYGESFYDADWRGPTGQGAMMERYDRRCLPIFPFANTYSCAFISLGDTAFFLAGEGRPSWMPRVCLFSRANHPPRADFVSHLPYSDGDSRRLAGLVQGYSFWVGMNGPPVQTGASPDRTNDGLILFGYAFESLARPDVVDRSAAPYRHPQSFYFSGVPVDPPNAPIVSQNYTDFAMAKPDPRVTWNLVDRLKPDTLPACQLFDPPKTVVETSMRAAGTPDADVKATLGSMAAIASHRYPTWGDLHR